MSLKFQFCFCLFGFFFVQIKAGQEKRKDTPPCDYRAARYLAARETETFYATLLVWTMILLVLTFCHLASAHLPLLLVIVPLTVRVFIWENFFAGKTADQHLEKFVLMHLLATLIPVLFCGYLTIAVFDVFVPIMSRAGTETPPDVFIAVLCASSVVMLSSHMVGTIFQINSICCCHIVLLTRTFSRKLLDEL